MPKNTYAIKPKKKKSTIKFNINMVVLYLIMLSIILTTISLLIHILINKFIKYINDNHECKLCISNIDFCRTIFNNLFIIIIVFYTIIVIVGLYALIKKKYTILLFFILISIILCSFSLVIMCLGCLYRLKFIKNSECPCLAKFKDKVKLYYKLGHILLIVILTLSTFIIAYFMNKYNLSFY